MKNLLITFLHVRNFKKNISFFIVILIFVCSGIFNSSFALSISGPNRVCPGNTATYTVSGLPVGTERWSYSFYEPTDSEHFRIHLNQ